MKTPCRLLLKGKHTAYYVDREGQIHQADGKPVYLLGVNKRASRYNEKGGKASDS